MLSFGRIILAESLKVRLYFLCILLFYMLSLHFTYGLPQQNGCRFPNYWKTVSGLYSAKMRKFSDSGGKYLQIDQNTLHTICRISC